MAKKPALVISAGRVEQLQTGDILDVDIAVETNGNAGTIVIGTPVYVAADGDVDKAKADAEATSHVYGLVLDTSIAAAASGDVKIDGIVDATTGEWDAVTGESGGLTEGPYYLDSATAGMLTTTRPTVEDYRVRVGVATSTTRMVLTLDEPFESQIEPLDPSIIRGRLTLVSGSPLGFTTDAATFYFTPYRGGTIGLYDGTRWHIRALSEISLAVPSTQFRLFDIFVYDNAGTLTLETADWNQTTGPIAGATNASPIVITDVAHGLSNGDMVGIMGTLVNTAPNENVWLVANKTDDTFELRGSTGNGVYTSGGTWFKMNGLSGSSLTTQDNILVQNGAATRRYLGVGMTDYTSGRCTVSITKVLLSNEYNKTDHRLTINAAGGAHTYGTSAWRPWADNGENTDWVVVPSTTIKALVSNSSLIVQSGGAAAPATGIGVNKNDGFNFAQGRNDGAAPALTGGMAVFTASNGFQLITAVERAFSGTGNFISMATDSSIPQ